MPRDGENRNVETTPNLDGEREGLINDTTASAGASMGIVVDQTMELGRQRNPYHFIPKENEEMKKLKKTMGAKKVEE